MQALATAWNNGDAAAWSAHLVEEVSHTVWNGHHIIRRDAVTAGHAHLFNTVYKGTRQVFNVRWVRFLRPDVAAVQWGSLYFSHRKRRSSKNDETEVSL